MILKSSQSSFDARKDLFKVTRTNIKKVPFVELFNGRLQGVVSSRSSDKLVYTAFFEAGTLNYYCSTNNNRRCAGLFDHPCSHLYHLLRKGVHAYGVEAVAQYLNVAGKVAKIKNIDDFPIRSGKIKKKSASEIFSRFLNYLRYLELESSSQPIPEMSWFI
ncbi:hypothetical protein [Mastigocoleus testarum]|uniref:Uncharacterized protein n=1 Tax=Mastigocoleus testarum BC008 TaxID=371196 RepID=A0A0V7ZFC9_9CYAN|nr:hypothetical protein [Mastigocoleus testarum]KST63167.1 hypothetical protein BC008_12750 [Mastigocoleus testarum BC008]KST63188.1 hypothetical protein BC008_12845 [Mastigocoleus testarum BC008]